MSKVTLEQLRKKRNLDKVITEILSKKFIFVEPVAEIIAAAIYAKQNVILYGPGGHAKSEMVECALEGLGLWDRNDPCGSSTLIQSFGEGLTEDALWGGIDFRKLNSPTDPEMWFNVQNSFLNYPVAVFEELFDAPAFCLLPLKHTLQSGFLGKNGHSYPMQTELIIACTNRNPAEISEMGETYRALLERFVLRQEVAWANYDVNSYTKLIAKHKNVDMLGTNGIKLLSQLMQECFEVGNFISPRTAMKAVDVVCGAAAARGAEKVDPDTDFIALQHVAGFGPVLRKFIENMQHKLNTLKSKEALEALKAEFDTLYAKFSSGKISRVLEWCITAKLFLTLEDKLNDLQIADSLYEDRSNLTAKCSELYNECTRKAIDATIL